jgi:hypothetical protein
MTFGVYHVSSADEDILIKAVLKTELSDRRGGRDEWNGERP